MILRVNLGIVIKGTYYTCSVKVFKYGVIMILKVLGPCFTLGAYSRCMNVVEGACKSNVYFVEST
jgi:hypothetical protein